MTRQLNISSFSFLLLLAGLLFLQVLLFNVDSVSSESVVALTPETFDEFVGGAKPALVEFYAPWCGHCKNLAPEYEIVGKSFEKLQNSVVVAKVDCDAHKSLCSKFEVKGFPTLKWFKESSPENPEQYSGGRTADDIVKFINQNTGLNAVVKRPPTLPSNVVVLNEENFNEIVLNTNKDVFVEFYAPWCGHCKKLAPEWDQLSRVFVSETDVVIAKVDCDSQPALRDIFGVEGFPTLKFFPKNDKKTGETYSGERTVQDFVNFINEKTGTARLPNGLLNKQAGRDSTFDKLAATLLAAAASGESAQVVNAAKKSAEASTAKTAQLYVKLFEKVAKSGRDYVEMELARLLRLIEADSITPAKRDEFVIRVNILNSFLPKVEKEEADEEKEKEEKEKDEL